MNVGYLVLGLIAGMGLPIQAAINTRLGAMLGNQPLISALVSFAVGTLTLIGVSAVFADWHTVQQGMTQADSQDWWKWIGGALGAFFVFVSIFLSPKIGITHMAFLFILGQLLMGMLIDSLGLFGMPVRALHWTKFFGIAVMLVGVSVFMFGQSGIFKARLKYLIMCINAILIMPLM